MRCASDVYTELLGKFTCRYILNLTASPIRDDGLSFIIFDYCGEILYQASVDDIVALGSVIKPHLIPIFFEKNKEYKEDDWHSLVERVKSDKNITRVVSGLIKHHFLQGDLQICIIKQIELIHKYYRYLTFYLKIPKKKIAILEGSTKEKDRKEILRRAKNKEITIILTSTIK